MTGGLGNKAALSMALVAFVMAGSIVSGCGGSDQAASLTKSQFVREANSICRNAEHQRLTALSNSNTEDAGNEPDQAELMTDIALPPVQEMTEELAELGIPTGDETEVQAIISAFEQGIATVNEDPTNVSAGMRAFSDATKLAEAYGLTDCGI
jgi:hypothetical protein